MRRQLDQQLKELEEKRRQFEKEKAAYEEQKVDGKKGFDRDPSNRSLRYVLRRKCKVQNDLAL